MPTKRRGIALIVFYSFPHQVSAATALINSTLPPTSPGPARKKTDGEGHVSHLRPQLEQLRQRCQVRQLYEQA
jgi:hypothetical protein